LLIAKRSQDRVGPLTEIRFVQAGVGPLPDEEISGVRPNPSSFLDLPCCGPAALSGGERILLWMLRQWVAARILGQEPRARLARYAGPFVSPRGAAAFVMLMTAVEDSVRRPLCVSHPDCVGYAQDEQRLITACGVSPAAPEVAARLLGGLVTAPGVVAVLARALNFSLAREGLNLPLRLEDDTAPLITPCQPTLH
jgi:hypothetical protein